MREPASRDLIPMKRTMGPIPPRQGEDYGLGRRRWERSSAPTQPRRRPSTAWPGLRSSKRGVSSWTGQTPRAASGQPTDHPSARPISCRMVPSCLRPKFAWMISLCSVTPRRHLPSCPTTTPCNRTNHLESLLTSSAPSILFPCATGLLASLWCIRVYRLQLAIPSVVC